MSNDFEIAFASLPFLDFKEKDLVTVLNEADDLCSHINSFLPAQLLCQEPETSDDDESSEVPKIKNESAKLFGNSTRAKTIEELYIRVEKLRGKGTNYKEKLLKKGLRNRLKKKQKQEERKQKANASRKSGNDERESFRVEEDSVKSEEKPEHIQVSNLQFNKLTVNKSEPEKRCKVTDPKRLLQIAEKKKEKLKKLEEKGKKEVVKEILGRETWTTAIRKAEGDKVRDNTELLKKTISRKENMKRKGQKRWEERERRLGERKDEAQKKRQENIIKKKKERSKKRTKILIKKGRILPK